MSNNESIKLELRKLARELITKEFGEEKDHHNLYVLRSPSPTLIGPNNKFGSYHHFVQPKYVTDTINNDRTIIWRINNIDIFDLQGFINLGKMFMLSDRPNNKNMYKSIYLDLTIKSYIDRYLDEDGKIDEFIIENLNRYLDYLMCHEIRWSLSAKIAEKFITPNLGIMNRNGRYYSNLSYYTTTLPIKLINDIVKFYGTCKWYISHGKLQELYTMAMFNVFDTSFYGYGYSDYLDGVIMYNTGRTLLNGKILWTFRRTDIMYPSYHYKFNKGDKYDYERISIKQSCGKNRICIS